MEDGSPFIRHNHSDGNRIKRGASRDECEKRGRAAVSVVQECWVSGNDFCLYFSLVMDSITNSYSS